MRRALLAIVSTVAGLVMLLSFKTQPLSPAVAATSPGASGSGSSGSGTSGSGSTPSGSTSGTSSSSTSSGSSSAGSSSAGSSSASSSGTRTVTGDAADTRYGPVQVQVTLTGHTITNVVVVQYPANDPRDQQINSYAIPLLTHATLTANSANVDMVSGATYTSDGYQRSLQSALDKAGW